MQYEFFTIAEVQLILCKSTKYFRNCKKNDKKNVSVLQSWLMVNQVFKVIALFSQYVKTLSKSRFLRVSSSSA